MKTSKIQEKNIYFIEKQIFKTSKTKCIGFKLGSSDYIVWLTLYPLQEHELTKQFILTNVVNIQ